MTLESPHGATPATLSSRPPAVRSRALSSLHEHFGILALSQALGSCPHPSLVYVCGALAQVPRPGPRSKCMQTRIHTWPSGPASCVHVSLCPFLCCFWSHFPVLIGLRRHCFPAKSRPVSRRRLRLAAADLLSLLCLFGASLAEKPGTSQRGISQRTLPEHVTSQAAPPRPALGCPASGGSHGWCRGGSTRSTWPR